MYKRQALISFSSAVRRCAFGACAASSGKGAKGDLTSTVVTSIEVILSLIHIYNLDDKVRSATTERFGQGMLFGMIKSAFYELRSSDQSSVRCV